MTAWDPEVLSRIHHLHLVAARVVDGLFQGGHRSLRLGPDIEFADYKEYTPGDPLRDLDWRVLARADRYVVRRYEAETDLACTLVVDASGDLGTGRRGPYGRPPLTGTKFGYTITLAATLAYYLHRAHEPVGLAIMGGEGAPFDRVPARSGAGHLAQIFGALASLRPSGVADIAAAVGRVAPGVRRRSLVAIVSDFMEDAAAWRPSLAALARRRTDLVAFHVLDRQELELDYEDPTVFYSPEDGDELIVDAPAAREAFRGVVHEWFDEVRGGVREHRGRYYPCWTDAPLEATLRQMIGGVISGQPAGARR